MKTLLLCGYRSNDEYEAPLGLKRDFEGVTLIDRRIRGLTQAGLEVLCVLSGACADEQLRQSREIARTELVFDTNDPDVSLMTNIKAGLAACVDEACFVLPVEIACLDPDCWTALRNGWVQHGMSSPVSVVQAVTVKGAPWHFGFPLLITRFGNSQIRTLQNLKSLVDTRLKYLHLVYSQDSILASAEKAA